MTLATPRPPRAVLASVLASGLLLVPPAPAHAVPAFTSADLTSYAFADTNGPCAPDDPSPLPPKSVAVAENGAPSGLADSVTRTFTHGLHPADRVDTTTTVQATATVASAAGRPTSLTLSFSGTASAVASQEQSGCSSAMALGVELDVEFTLAQPRWATLTASGQGPGSSGAGVFPATTPWDALGIEGTGARTVFLGPGAYGGFLYGDTDFPAATTSSATRSGSVAITFATPGSATRTPGGRARRYVLLPAARACEAHRATAALTSRRTRAARIRKVILRVDGARAAVLHGRRLRTDRRIVLPLDDRRAVDITATVRLRNGSRRTVQASYLACTD